MLNGKPVVIIDCDDVVARCLNEMSKEMNAKLGTSVTDEDITTWDFHDTFGGDDLKEHIHGKMAEEGWCAKLEPFPGAVEGIRRLKEVAEVFFCTAPYKGAFWPHERRIWLQEKFKIDHWRVIQSSSKFLVRGELFIDDKVDHCIEWQNYGEKNFLGGMAFLWDRPHNRKDPRAAAFRRFTNWDQVCRLAEILPR